MALDTTFDLQPETDLPDHETDLPNDTQTDPAPATPDTDRPAAEPVSHTPGGLPAIPLAITTANSAIAGLSAAAITGGPIGVTAAGIALAAVTTGVAARSSHKKKSRQAAASRSTSPSRTSQGGTPARTGATAPNRPNRSTSPSAAGRGGASNAGRGGSSASGKAGRSPMTSHGARTAGAAPRGGNRSGGLNLQKAPGRNASPRHTGSGAVPGARTGGGLSKTPVRGNGAGKGGTLRAGNTARKNPAGSTTKPTSSSAKGAGRLGAIKNLRKDAKSSAPTRAALRKQDTANRNRLADAKRNLKDAKHDARIGRLNKKGAAAQTLAKALDRAHKARRATADAARDRKAQKVASRLDRIRGMRRHAAARLRMRRRLATSALRYWGRRLLNASIAAPFGLLGILTTPLGRKLGWAWLIKPGSKLLARLNQRARNARAFRDHDIRAAHKTDTQRINDEIAGTVPRAPRHHNTYDAGVTVSEALKFLFDESASEMEAAAQAYEPGGNMHVLQTIEGMPAAVQSFANTFAIIAEKSDESWAMEPEVGEALQDVFQMLSKAAEAAEVVKEVFEAVHAHDIARIRDPRGSAEAEKGWDVINNEDYA
ncbi:hypothetical protein [Streptomyces sioyaensis]|uniref:hypothetical protein n=1 Tax=Streptomyces sioyaensis TaxID=67364 RepID=UPI0037A7F43B